MLVAQTIGYLISYGLLVMLVVFIPGTARAIITDDACTQGKGKFQVELTGQYDFDEESEEGVTLKSRYGQIGATLYYGVIEGIDVILSAPYQWGKEKEEGIVTYKEKGISDTTFEIKWRFFEKDGFSLAFKPGVILATGEEEKGLGVGKTGYQAFFIGSKEAEPWAFHVNVGYIRNENKFDEESNIWHASLAATFNVTKNLTLAGNIGIEKNPDKAVDRNPSFLFGGIIYSISENFDIDMGVKYGLTAPEADLSLMVGATFRF